MGAESSGVWQVKDVEVQINTVDRNFSWIPSVKAGGAQVHTPLPSEKRTAYKEGLLSEKWLNPRPESGLTPSFPIY